MGFPVPFADWPDLFGAVRVAQSAMGRTPTAAESALVQDIAMGLAHAFRANVAPLDATWWRWPGDAGTLGQYLRTRGDGQLEWANLEALNQGEVRWYELTVNGNNYVAFKAPAALSTDVILTLPDNDGATDQVLRTNGTGVLSWVDQSGGGGTTSWSRFFAVMGA